MSFKEMSISNPPIKVSKSRRPTRKREKNEDKIVYECIEWWDNTYPHLRDSLFMINNDAFFGWDDETRINVGHRNKRKGLRSGVGDHFLMLPKAMHGVMYHGAFIEFKSPKGRQSDNQKEFEKRAREAGYYYALISPKAKDNAEVFQHFKQFIEWYVNDK